MTHPPEELLKLYEDDILCERENVDVTLAAMWRAGYDAGRSTGEAELQKARDEELDACCEWLDNRMRRDPFFAKALRSARRPKPKSKAEEALEVFRSMQIEPVVINGIDVHAELRAKYDVVHAALMRLCELEASIKGMRERSEALLERYLEEGNLA